MTLSPHFGNARRPGLFTAACALLLTLPATTTFADKADGSLMLEEIVVTAQKRSENLQSTPIAISAFSSSKIEKMGYSNISQMADATPNTVFDSTAPVSGVSSGAVVFIRGVGQTDFSLATDPGVGTYVDGVYVSRSIGGVLDTLDIERVEILRGPQGTLFGRNTIGGAISITSKEPAEEFTGSGEVILGNFNRHDMRFSVDLPVSDTLLTRVAGSSKNRDGFVRGISDNRLLGNENRDSARFTALYTAGDAWKFTLNADATRIREQNAGSTLVGITSAPPGAPGDIGPNGVPLINPTSPTLAWVHNNVDAGVFGLPLFTEDAYIPADKDTTYATGANGTSLDIWGISLTAEWDVNDTTTLKSTTAYRETSGYFNRDADNSPLVVTETNNYDYGHEQFSQEFQLVGTLLDGNLKYASGVYYFSESGHDLLTVRFPATFGTLDNRTYVDNESLGVYAQATYIINDRLSATAGLRYSRDEKSYDPFQILTVGPVGAGAFGVAPGDGVALVPPGQDSLTFTDWSPRFSLDYQLTEDALVYASYTQGYKSGGFNIRYLLPVPEAVQFEPETVENYEIGLKLDLFDNRVRLNTAAFWANYNQIQVITYVSGAPLNTNGGEAEIKGIEAEITALITDRLQLSGGLGYTDAHYTAVPAFNTDLPAVIQITGDKKLANLPEWSLNASAEYSLPLPNDGELALRGDWSYKSTIWNDAQNSPYLKQEGYHLVNASLTYSHPGEVWNVRLYVDNLTDKRVIVSGDSNFALGFHEANYNRPREWGASLRVNF
ncbi:TonB-dependent receptor [Emcibacter sp.]|uniref:TonB-dependent receptor n=1 Tax=Emcibacter sp. TaxID=1979954 RepID=UPI002AA86846|nr:TonB-dependent receptor [Emcibacter sp.]